MTERHASKRFQKMFEPNHGRVCEATKDNLDSAKAGTLQVHLRALEINKFTAPIDGNEAEEKGIHPLTRVKGSYLLTDRFHQRNVKHKYDRYLRNINLVPELSAVNTQVGEELFQEFKKDVYYITQMKMAMYHFQLRLRFELKNKKINDDFLREMQENCPEGNEVGWMRDGRVHYRPRQRDESVEEPEHLDVHENDEEAAFHDLGVPRQELPQTIRTRPLVNPRNGCWYNSSLQALNRVLDVGMYIP